MESIMGERGRGDGTITSRVTGNNRFDLSVYSLMISYLVVKWIIKSKL
jgi:hypothetical protein